jgi:hypothetical protein
LAGWVEAELRRTVKDAGAVPEAGSVTVPASLTDTAGCGGSRIVPVASPRAILALTGFESLTVNVSGPSHVPSPRTGTEIVLVVSPGANVKVPEVWR